MKYSYIKARKKSVVSPELKLLLSFFTITIVMLFLTYLFLVFKDYMFLSDIEEMSLKKVELENDVAKMQSQITYIEKEMLLYERVCTENSVLKDSIANLFDLVPDKITLSQASLLKNGLVLHGITPSKDVYNFMLQAPLRSIFSETYTSFYPEQNGWLRFVSTNYIDEEDLETTQIKESEDD